MRKKNYSDKSDKKTKKKALIFSHGGLYGAYSAGIAIGLCEELGSDYFDSVYCYSVGSAIGTFFVANQPEIIENTWGNYVDKNKLMKPYNFLKGKPLLDLDYLISLFKSNISKLDIDAVLSSRTSLNYALIDYYSGKISWIKPQKENIFELIKACCSLPIVHGPSLVNNKLFLDAAFVSGEFPMIQGIAEKYDEIILILNLPLNHAPKKIWWPIINLFFPIASYFYPKPLREVFKRRKEKLRKNIKFINANNKIKVLAPDKIILNYGGDSDRSKIKKTIELGKKNVRLFLKERFNS